MAAEANTLRPHVPRAARRMGVEEVVPVRRYLVVANQTLGGSHLAEAVQTRLSAGPCAFHILVPATPPQDQGTWTEGEAEAIARERLDKAIVRFGELGAEATGEVGDPDPLQAVRDALAVERYDELILSTLPSGASRWLKRDLPSRVEKAFPFPVTHIEARPEE